MDAPTPQDAAVLVEREGAIGWITLNRPDAVNAINDAVRTGVSAALAALDADPAVRVLVLRGAGPRGFCAGADLRERREPPTPAPTAAQVRAEPPRAAWFDAFDRVGKPVLASIHGFCLGGGFEIALACDIRLASADATFALPETGLGLIPGGGGTQRLPRLIGMGQALLMLLGGERIDAAEALRQGVLQRVLPDAQALQAETRRLALALAARPPLALRFAKEAALASTRLDLAQGLRLERDLFALLAGTDDAREAAAAFRDKRAPVFHGR